MTDARIDVHEQERTSPKAPADDSASLSELLSETRILLPGTEVFLGFLATLPFSRRFPELAPLERTVFLCTFFATLVSLACFVAPTAYHRIARPIHHKERFKLFANRFLVIGLVPVSISIVLASFLVTSVAVGRTYGIVGGAVMAVLIAVLWWVIPMLRAHDRVRETSSG